MKKVIVNFDEVSNNISTEAGVYIGICTEPLQEADNVKNQTIELVKLGVTVDEIIKLKNMDLI